MCISILKHDFIPIYNYDGLSAFLLFPSSDCADDLILKETDFQSLLFDIFPSIYLFCSSSVKHSFLQTFLIYIHLFISYIYTRWLVGWILWHINLCRLFNAKSMFLKIVLFQTIQFKISTEFNCKNSLIVKNISISSYLVKQFLFN